MKSSPNLRWDILLVVLCGKSGLRPHDDEEIAAARADYFRT